MTNATIAALREALGDVGGEPEHITAGEVLVLAVDEQDPNGPLDAYAMQRDICGGVSIAWVVEDEQGSRVAGALHIPETVRAAFAPHFAGRTQP